MRKYWVVLLCGIALALPMGSQENLGKKAYVQLMNVSPVTASYGKAGVVTMSFRVAPGYHINSNKPNSDLLIPTTLKLSPPTDISLANITYPPGEDRAFPFSPDQKLSIYEGDFSITAKVLSVGAVHPGAYRVHGELRYQACDDKACYPPKVLPLNVDIQIKKSGSRAK